MYDGIFTTFTLSFPYLVRSAVLKWHWGAGFDRHRDIELPANHLRLWATMSDKMVLKIDDEEIRDIELR